MPATTAAATAAPQRRRVNLILPRLAFLARWPSKEEGARAIAACLGLLEAVILADGRAATAAVAERDASLLSAISVILSSSDDVTERLQAVSMRVLTAVADKGHREVREGCPARPLPG